MVNVSVIMPCFNHGRFLAESVEAVLSQSIGGIELIVIDDHSSDDSYDRLLALGANDRRIRVVRHRQNQGASSSRNDGLRLAEGNFIAFCDADDVWETDKLKTQLDLLSKNQRDAVVYSDALIIDEHGKSVGKRFSELFPPPREPSGDLFNDLCVRNFINMQTVMLRRDCLQESLLFDENIKWVEDWWYWIKLSRRHSFLYSPQPLAKYRTHSQSTKTTQRRGYDFNRFKVFRRTLALRPDLSPVLESQIWYHMACILRRLGKPRLAKTFLRQALDIGIHDPHAARHCIRPIARLIWWGT